MTRWESFTLRMVVVKLIKYFQSIVYLEQDRPTYHPKIVIIVIIVIIIIIIIITALQ
jgi:hypothetical protein